MAGVHERQHACSAVHSAAASEGSVPPAAKTPADSRYQQHKGSVHRVARLAVRERYVGKNKQGTNFSRVASGMYDYITLISSAPAACRQEYSGGVFGVSALQNTDAEHRLSYEPSIEPLKALSVVVR